MIRTRPMDGGLRPRRAARWTALACMAGACLAAWPAGAGDAEARRQLRRTPLVELYENCKDSMASITGRSKEQGPATQPASSGPAKTVTVVHTQRSSGFLIHPDGFLLTNSHAVKLGPDREARLEDGSTYRLRVIARDDSLDVALLKIKAPRALKPLKLGHSRNLMVGERAILLGYPFDLGLTLSAGIVSAVGRRTRTDFTLLTDTIQTNADINPGTSGGPLLNALGEVIGIATSQKREGQGLGFAIAIDDVRAALPEMLAADRRYGFVLGMSVDANDAATVTAIEKGSPAEAAGVAPGDVVRAVDGKDCAGGIDYHLALVGRRAGETLKLRLLRDGKDVEADVKLGRRPLRPAEKIDGLVAGLDWRACEGQWTRLPDFDRLAPAATGSTPTFSLGSYAGRDHYGLRFSGYLRAPADGVYLFYLASDDGSRLTIGGQVVVDNDGLHGAGEKRGFASLKAGLHPIVVEFFEASGDEELKVSWEGPRLPKQPIAPDALFHKPAPGKEKT